MAVISLYSLDCKQLISSLREHGLGQVEVSTTRRFMGRSKPIIFTHVPQAVPHRFIKEDANPFGFLEDKKLLLLHTSCAQSFCIYVGYWEMLEEYLRNPVVQRMNRRYSWISAWLLHMRQKNRLVQYPA